MNRLVIYAIVVGTLAGFFISLFLFEKKASPPKAESQKTLEYPELSSPLVQSLIKSETRLNQQKALPANIPAEQQNGYNLLLILEDAYEKKDWKNFLQTLEAIQGDKKYPLPGIISLLRNGFSQSAVTFLQNTDSSNALFIAENILKGNLPEADKNQKIEVLKTIGKKGEGVTSLLKWVIENEKDVQLSSLALNAMGETKDPVLIPFLSDYAKTQHELPLRLAAIEALENFDSDAIETLEGLLNALELGKGNEELVLKSTIMETLGSIGNSEAISLLSNLVRKQKGLRNLDSYVLQQDAISALGDIGSPEAISSIGEIVADEGIDAQLRGFALNTLVKANKKEEGVQILEDIVNDRTIQKLEIKKAAIDALGDIKGPEAVTFLAELITRHNNETPVPLQLEALSAMGQIGGPETIPILENIINNEYVDTEVRQDAIYALGKAGGDRAVSALERIANDTAAPNFSRAALRGLQKIGSSDSISIIESVARDHPSEDIRLIASKLLEVSRNSRLGRGFDSQ